MNDDAVLLKLSKDHRELVKTMTPNQARYLVDSYYQMQQNRLRAAGQIRTCGDEPHAVLQWVETNAGQVERWIVSALKSFAEAHPMGRWALEVHGIGPVIAAGLLAHIDITKAPTVGHIWRFAGQDATVTWLSSEKCLAWVKANGGATEELIPAAAKHFGRAECTVRKFATTDATGAPVKLTDKTLAAALARRPHNAALKQVCFHLGECFIRTKSSAHDVYGKLYDQRKAYEQERNEAGAYAGEAAKRLEQNPKHKQRSIYKQGKLPPGHIHARCRRWVVKQFLSDYHAEAYRQHYGSEPPNPYPIAILGHAHLRQAA